MAILVVADTQGGVPKGDTVADHRFAIQPQVIIVDVNAFLAGFHLAVTVVADNVRRRFFGVFIQIFRPGVGTGRFVHTFPIWQQVGVRM